MPEIRIPVIISGADALREMDSVAKGTTSSLIGVENASKALQSTSQISSAAIKEMTAALNANTAALQAITPAAGSASNALRQVGSAGISGATEARLAMRGLGTEMGVAMPRYVASFLASIGGVGPIMAAAFAPIAVIGLIEVLGSAVNKIGEMKDAWDPVVQAEKRAMDEGKKLLEDFSSNADKIQEEIYKKAERQRGKVYALQLEIADKNLTISSDDQSKINQAASKITATQQRIDAGTFVVASDPYQHLTKDAQAAQVEQNTAKKELENAQQAQKLHQLQLDDKQGELKKEQDRKSTEAGEKLKTAHSEITSYIERSLSPLQRTTAEYQKQLEILKKFPSAGNGASLRAAYTRDFLGALNTSNEAFQRKNEEARSKARSEITPMEESGSKYIDDGLEADQKQISKDVSEFLRKNVVLARPSAQAGYVSIDQQRAQLEHQTRMIGINAVPGQEAQTAIQQTNSRLAMITTIRDRELEILDVNRDAEKIAEIKANAELESAQARYALEEKIGELQKKQLEDYRKTAGEIFNALDSKRGPGRGLSEFFQSQVKGLEKTLFTNALSIGPNGGVMSSLARGIGNVARGQTDANNNPTLIGRLLQGTPLGKDETRDLQAVANERLLLNNNFTDINNKESARLNGNLEGKTTGESGSGAGSGGFSSALSTFAALVHSGSASSALVSGASVLASSAKVANQMSTAQQVSVALKARGVSQDVIDSTVQALAYGTSLDSQVGTANLNTAVAMHDDRYINLPPTNAQSPDSHDPEIGRLSRQFDPSWATKDLTKTNDWLTDHASAISAGGTAAATGFGAYEGFHQGGTRGDLAGTASLVGGVTSLLGNPAIQKMIGTVASSIPIVGGVISAGLGLFSSLIGQSVQQRQNQIQNIIGGSFDRLPQAKNEQFDITGYQSDMTGANSARPIVNQSISIPVSAFDSKSVEDHWPAIANAVATAANMGHPVVDSMRQARVGS